MSSVGPKLIGSTKSRAFRCLWMLEELGNIGSSIEGLFPYQFIYAQPQSKLVVKYNPLGKIPILLESDGFVLYESSAIITYLGDKYNYNYHNQNRYHTLLSPAPPTTATITATTTQNLLVPLAGTHKRGLYDQTMSVLQTELDAQGLWIHRKHEVMGKYFTYIPDAVKHARKYFNKTNRILIQQLKDNNNASPLSSSYYLLGSQFTAVDIVYIHCLQWSQSIGWDNKWKDDKFLLQYIEFCTSRVAYQKTASIKDNDNNNDNDNDDGEDYQKKKLPTSSIISINSNL